MGDTTLVLISRRGVGIVAQGLSCPCELRVECLVLVLAACSALNPAFSLCLGRQTMSATCTGDPDRIPGS